MSPSNVQPDLDRNGARHVAADVSALHDDGAARRGASSSGRLGPGMVVALALMWNLLWSRLHTMETIQVVMEGGLLKAADRAARKLKVNRSALIRDAVREHLKRLHTRQLELQERDAYDRIPDDPEEFAVWNKVAAWPRE